MSAITRSRGENRVAHVHGVISAADQGHPIGAQEFADSHFPAAPPNNYGGRDSDQTQREAREKVSGPRPIF
jgi:hypothetical protein